MTRRGRDLEKIIASLEKINMKNATIKSPDFIPDKDTGTPREIDVSVRFSQGTHDFLVIFECRDRKARAGVEWIEQLANKSRSVRADKVIAVSSSGFTKNATIKAKEYNIECRTVAGHLGKTLVAWFNTDKNRTQLISFIIRLLHL